MNNATLLQRRRKSIRICKEETLLMLRAYRAHPTRWNDVIDDIKQNLDRLPQQVIDLYNSATVKQLRDRLSAKLAKLMAARNIEDQDIRGEVDSIRDNERHLLRNASQIGDARRQNGQQQVQAPPAADQEEDTQQDDGDQADDEQAAPARRADRRDAAAAALSDNDSADDAPEPPRQRRRLAELIIENHEMYNHFMKKKLPKLIREFGISSSDSE